MGASDPPPWPLDAKVRGLLARLASKPALDVEGWFRAGLRRGFLLSGERASERPLEGGLLDRLVGRGPEASLPLLGSKLGGCPYLEAAADWPAGYRFLGQIDFGALGEKIDGLPARGVLVLFIGGLDALEPIRVVWYPTPALEKALPRRGGKCFGRYEARLVATPAWLPPETEAGKAFPAPEDDEPLFEAVTEWTTRFLEKQGYREGMHLLGPPPLQVLTDQFRPDELADLAIVLRLDSDVAAEVSFGPNVVYVLTARADLAAGKLERCFGVVANY